MDLLPWIDALLASPITSGTPRYLEHSLRGRLVAWEVVATGDPRAPRVHAWWSQGLALAGGESLAQSESWWRPWRDREALELAWNRCRGGLRWVADALFDELPEPPPRALSLRERFERGVDGDDAYPDPEAFEAELEQLLRAWELVVAHEQPGTPRRLAGRLHAARKATRGLGAPVTLHVPLYEVRSVQEMVRDRGAAPVTAVHDAYARVVFYGARARDRCAAAFSP
jgi:hypothetical protein